MAEQTEANLSPDEIEYQIKELELAKHKEELKQLRSSAKIKWLTPTALAALLPIVAGLGLWIVGELKEYNKGYQALAKLEAIESEMAKLQSQKDSLNIELATLIQLKAHYSTEAERLRRDTEAKQETIDKTYLRGVFTRWETLYALDHVLGQDVEIEPEELAQIKDEINQYSAASKRKLLEILSGYSFSLDMMKISRDIIAEFDKALELMPASDWTRELRATPGGYFISGRNIMVSQNENGVQYYDVTEGRFLTSEEHQLLQNK